MNVAVWAVFVYGLVYLGVAASITSVPRLFVYNLLTQIPGLRHLAGVLSCGPCFGFWVGVCVGLPQGVELVGVAPSLYVHDPLWAGLLARGVAGVLTMGLVAATQYFFGVAISQIARDEVERARAEAAERDKVVYSVELQPVVESLAGLFDEMSDAIHSVVFPPPPDPPKGGGESN